MSGDELCFTAKTQFFSLLMSDLVMLISFIFSHPLYLPYFVFFSPYLIKLICFISPLFITTVLVSLAFFTSTDQLAVVVHKSPVSLFCASVLGRSRNEDDDFHQTHVEAPEILLFYEIFFGSNVTDVEDHQIPIQVLEETSDESSYLEASESTHHEDFTSSKTEDLSGGDVELEEKTVLDSKLEDVSCETEEKRSKNFMKILHEFEKMSTDVEHKRKAVKPTKSVKNDDDIVEKQKSAAGSLFTNGSGPKVTNNKTNIQKVTNSDEEDEPKTGDGSSGITAVAQKTSLDRNYDAQTPSSSRTMDYYNNYNNNNNVGTYGSMRKEKEWKRTLACKLFEERHNVDGGDGMDSLWEAYEVNSNILQKQKHEKSIKKSKNKMMMKKKKSEIEEFIDDEEEEINGTGQLCCLQALRLSTGKMNLGMGRPNLVKISKAIKGFGWLSKHSKKVHSI